MAKGCLQGMGFCAGCILFPIVAVLVLAWLGDAHYRAQEADFFGAYAGKRVMLRVAPKGSMYWSLDFSTNPTTRVGIPQQEEFVTGHWWHHLRRTVVVCEVGPIEAMDGTSLPVSSDFRLKQVGILASRVPSPYRFPDPVCGDPSMGWFTACGTLRHESGGKPDDFALLDDCVTPWGCPRSAGSGR